MSRLTRFFRTFPWPKKSARVAAHSSAELDAHSSSSTPHENDPVTTWVDDTGDAWTLVPTSLGVCWLNLLTMHTWWQPPWWRQSWRCLRFSSSSAGAPVLGHGCWWARGFDRPLRPWKNSTFLTRSWTWGHFFNNPFASGSHFPGVLASVYSYVWKNFTHFLVFAVKIWT